MAECTVEHSATAGVGRVRRRVIAGLASAALAAGVLTVPAAAEPSTSSVIVIVDDHASPAAVAAAVTVEHGGHVGDVYDHVVGGFQLDASATAIGAIGQAPGIRAVVPDQTFRLRDVAGSGFFRIGADTSVNDSRGPYRGASTRIATIDTGIDATHPDLAPHLDLAHSYNCLGPGVPVDDNGHGTHVAGIAAAAFNSDGFGVVGVAPEASIVALKAFDASGTGSTSSIVCALDHLAQITVSAPMPTAVNMSFSAVGRDTQCNDGIVTDVLHEALCALVATGTAAGVPVIPVAAAGNDDVNAARNIPAAFHDVITVSAFSEADSQPGGLAGCPYIASENNSECDDTLASFSNWGSAIDVTAPGVQIYSDYPPAPSPPSPARAWRLPMSVASSPRCWARTRRSTPRVRARCCSRPASVPTEPRRAPTRHAPTKGNGSRPPTTRSSTRRAPSPIPTALLNHSSTPTVPARAAQAAFPATVPGPPTIGAAEAGINQATVAWTAPVSNGGSPITGYVVTPYIGFIAQPSVRFNSTATTATVTGLTHDATYRFKVAAINGIGTGPSSKVSNPVTPVVTAPGAPTIGTAIAGDGQATVSWSAPASDGGSPITGYVVTAYVGLQLGQGADLQFDVDDTDGHRLDEWRDLPVPGARVQRHRTQWVLEDDQPSHTKRLRR